MLTMQSTGWKMLVSNSNSSVVHATLRRHRLSKRYASRKLIVENKNFDIAWPEDFSIAGEIEWTLPHSHDLLFTGNIEEDDYAYFYTIVALHNKKWLPFYIGIAFDQSVSERHKQEDHRKKIENLKRQHPNTTFNISLGIPQLSVGNLTKKNVESIEGLLIYSNWNEQMVNIKNINKFSSAKQIYIKNTGFIEHLEEFVVYGVVYKNA